MKRRRRVRAARHMSVRLRRSSGTLGDDEGSVLLLGIGLVIVCLLAVVVVVDASAAFLQRRALMSLADGAALAGAQAIDLDHYYAHGATTGTRLTGAGVVSAARAHLAAADPEVTIEQIATDGVSVRVRLSMPVRLPFLGSGRTEVVRAQGSARLDYRPT